MSAKKTQTPDNDAIREQLAKAVEEHEKTETELNKAQETITELQEQLKKSTEANEKLTERMTELEEKFKSKSEKDDDIFKSLKLEKHLETDDTVEVNEFLDRLINDTRQGMSVINKALTGQVDDTRMIMKSMLVVMQEVQELRKAVDDFLAQPQNGYLGKGLPAAVRKSIEEKNLPQPTKEQIFKAVRDKMVNEKEQIALKNGRLDLIPEEKLRKVAAL